MCIRDRCNKSFIKWHEGFAEKIHFQRNKSIVTTSDGKSYSARLVVDATGYDPVFLKLKSCGPLAVQTCYGIVGSFSKPPLKKGQFVLMDYRNDHLTCLLYTSPSPRDVEESRMPSSA